MYNQDFYESQAKGSLRSAEEVVPIIVELIHPSSVVDVGCGIGTWLSVYKNLGVEEILGIDGDYVSKDMLLIDTSEFNARNLKRPINSEKNFDLVQSLEVAEHLDSNYAEQFVISLTNLGDVVAFAAAIPYQLGTGHVNEQFIDYWSEIFEGQGYFPIDCIRPRIWNNDKIEPWYKQNLVLFANKDYLESHPWMKQEQERTLARYISVVHPDLYKLRISMLVKVVVQAAHQLHLSRDRAAAEALYKLALHHDSELGEVWDALGRMAAENGQYNEALEKIRKALLLQPTAGYYVNASKVCVALGKFTSAREYVKKALLLSPDFEPAKVLLKELKNR